MTGTGAWGCSAMVMTKDLSIKYKNPIKLYHKEFYKDIKNNVEY